MSRSLRKSNVTFFEHGFTLVELLVVIAIISILMSLLLPAVQSAREVARRSQCAHQLSMILMATHQYEMAWESYPMGSRASQGPIRNVAEGKHHNWLLLLLPYLDQSNAYEAVDQSLSVYDPANAPVRKLTISKFLCPSDSLPAKDAQRTHSFSSYAGSHHDIEAPIDTSNSGVFVLNAHIRYEDVTDGSSQTIYIGEKLVDVAKDLGWMSGTSATLRNTGGPPSSPASLSVLIPSAKPDSTDQNKSNSWTIPPGRPMMSRPTDRFMGPGPAAGTPNPTSSSSLDPNGVPVTSDMLGGGTGKAGEHDVPTDGQNPEPTENSAAPQPAGVSPLHVGGFGSAHPTGANMGFGDGSIRFIGASIHLPTLQQLGNRSDGALLDDALWLPNHTN